MGLKSSRRCKTRRQTIRAIVDDLCKSGSKLGNASSIGLLLFVTLSKNDFTGHGGCWEKGVRRFELASYNSSGHAHILSFPRFPLVSLFSCPLVPSSGFSSSRFSFPRLLSSPSSLLFSTHLQCSNPACKTVLAVPQVVWQWTCTVTPSFFSVLLPLLKNSFSLVIFLFREGRRERSKKREEREEKRERSEKRGEKREESECVVLHTFSLLQGCQFMNTAGFAFHFCCCFTSFLCANFVCFLHFCLAQGPSVRNARSLDLHRSKHEQRDNARVQMDLHAYMNAAQNRT